ncbi:MAG: hypothetical protein ACSLEW_09170 [Nocardioides sp.]
MSEYDDNDLVRALRAPGTPSELAGEEAIVAAYRSEHRRRGGLVRRLGLGGTTAVLVIGLSGGVAAAAWTNLLPDPVQDVAHGAFGSIGVPKPAGPDPEVDAAADPLPSEESAATSSTPTTPDTPGDIASTSESPGPTSQATVEQPSQEPTSTPTSPPGTSQPGQAPTPSGSPSAPQTSVPTPKPEAVTAKASAATVSEGGSVSVAGVVTDEAGKAMPDRAVALVVRTANSSWRVVAHTRTDSIGAVTLASPALAASTSLRLVTGGIHSDVVRIGVKPALSATWADGVITVRSSSSWAGEQVRLMVGKRVLDTATLGATGDSTIAVQSRKIPMKVRVTLKATPQHRPATSTVVVPKMADGSGSGRLSYSPQTPLTAVGPARSLGL